MDHNELWKILQEMGIPEPFTCLLRNLYAGQEATITTRHETTDWSQMGKGVRQGCILSPCSFNWHAEWKVKVKVAQWCPTLCDPMDCPWTSLGQNTGVGNFSLLQGVFPTKRLNPGLPHCRQILYQLSHQGSPRKLEWIAYPFSRGSFWPRNQSRVSWIAGRFFTNWTLRETP